MDPLFALIVEELASLDDEEIATARDTLRARIAEVAAGRRDPEIVGERTQADVATEMAAAVEALAAMETEIENRAAAEGEYDAEVARLAAEAGVEPTAEAEGDDEGDGDAGDGDGEGDAEGDGEAEGETAPEAIAAAAAAAIRRPLPAARRHRPTPTEIDSRGLRVTQHAAGLGVPFEAGMSLGRRDVGELLYDIISRGRVKPGQRSVVASASYEFPRERVLDGGPESLETNSMKIQSVTGMDALVASGGSSPCAPVTPIYDLPGVETADRPVRDTALASFQATRGGVQVGANPTMGTFADAVGVITADENADGGTLAIKNCHRIDCPDFESVKVDSIYHCVEQDNLAARAYPELMSRVEALVRAEHARLAESTLLTTISAGSTQVDAGEITPGAVASFLGAWYQAAAGMRSRNRMPIGTTLRAILPEWAPDLFATDLARSQFDRFQTRQQIIAILGQAGINVTFTLDGSATAEDGQVFGPQTDGNLVLFPDTIEGFLYPEGSWLHLDSGVLELGVVRDSSLNRTNDFEIFGETWENVAFVGVESLAITFTVCPSGEVAAPAQTAYCGQGA